MRKLIGILILAASTLLAACGGGGGYAGDQGPTHALRMSPLLSSATMRVGYVADVAKISQGVGPYHVLSSDPSVGAELLDDGTLRLYGIKPGTSTVAVQDSSVKQASLSLSVNVVVPDLAISIGNELTLAPGQIQSFTVYGGGAPYTVTSSDSAIVSVFGGANGTYTLQAGTTLGKATILIKDSYGSSLTISVTNAVAHQLAVSPAAVSGLTGTMGYVSIIGGVGPYSVISSNPSVASVSLSGSVATVRLLTSGTSTLTVLDATGALVTASVNVADPPPPPPPAPVVPAFAVVPPSQILSETGVSNSVVFTAVNGTGPFYVTIPSSSLSLIQPNAPVETGNTITINRVAGACIAADTDIPVVITDAATGKTTTVHVFMPDDPTNNPCSP